MSYHSDILLWSEQQADLLRRMARGERVNGLDWENVAEEIESVGRSELRAVESQLRVALTHLLYLLHAPERAPVAHWSTEVLAALDNAQRGYAPSMAQRIDLDRIWRSACRLTAPKLEEMGLVLPPPGAECPVTLAELLAEDVEIPRLLARLTA
jgi:hypothetical protein